MAIASRPQTRRSAGHTRRFGISRQRIHSRWARAWSNNNPFLKRRLDPAILSGSCMREECTSLTAPALYQVPRRRRTSYHDAGEVSGCTEGAAAATRDLHVILLLLCCAFDTDLPWPSRARDPTPFGAEHGSGIPQMHRSLSVAPPALASKAPREPRHRRKSARQRQRGGTSRAPAAQAETGEDSVPAPCAKHHGSDPPRDP